MAFARDCRAGLVHALLYDRKGTLWVGTDAGLYTKIGEAFQPVTETGVLHDNRINALLEGVDGTLWAGSADHGLFCSTRPGEEPFVHQDGVASNKVRSLFQSADGDLWVGTQEAGVTRLRRSGFETITESENLLDPYARSLCEDGDGNVWVITESGLSRCRDGRATVLGPRENTPKNISGISAGCRRQAVCDHSCLARGTLALSVERWPVRGAGRHE